MSRYRLSNVGRLFDGRRLVDVERLFADLQAVVAPLDASITEEEAGHATRHAAALQLAKLLNLLRRLGQPLEDRSPLMALFSALADLDNGTVAPLLKPVEYGKGSRPMPATRRAVLTAAAAALTILAQRGAGTEDAAKHICRELRKHDALPGGSRYQDKPDHVSLIEWRKSLKAGRAPGANVHQYKKLLELYKDADASEIIQAIIVVTPPHSA